MNLMDFRSRRWSWQGWKYSKGQIVSKSQNCSQKSWKTSKETKRQWSWRRCTDSRQVLHQDYHIVEQYLKCYECFKRAVSMLQCCLNSRDLFIARGTWTELWESHTFLPFCLAIAEIFFFSSISLWGDGSLRGFEALWLTLEKVSWVRDVYTKLNCAPCDSGASKSRLDTDDKRFAALFDNSEFALDPTDPRFLASETNTKILRENAKRRSKKPSKAELSELPQSSLVISEGEQYSTL